MWYPNKYLIRRCGGMVDTGDLKSPGSNAVPVRVRSPAPPGTVQYRGVEQLVARRAHNPEVGGSSPPSATIEKVPIFEPGNSGFKNGNFSFILGSRKELRFVLNRSFHVQLSMRSVTVVKFDILF